MYWLRHAIAAATKLTAGGQPEADIADRLSTAALLNGLEYFADKEEWAAVTLQDIVRYASLMGEKFSQMCTCGQNGPSSTLKW